MEVGGEATRSTPADSRVLTPKHIYRLDYEQIHMNLSYFLADLRQKFCPYDISSDVIGSDFSGEVLACRFSSDGTSVAAALSSGPIQVKSRSTFLARFFDLHAWNSFLRS
jgi:hypothetical protein